jgi:hypothetical protein
MSFVRIFYDRWFETNSQKLDGPVMKSLFATAVAHAF